MWEQPDGTHLEDDSQQVSLTKVDKGDGWATVGGGNFCNVKCKVTGR